MQEYADQPDGGSFAQSRGYFEELVAWAAGPDAAGLELAGLEEGLEERARELMRLVLQDHLRQRQAREERREGVRGPDGAVRTRAETGHQRQVATVFGKVTAGRIAYRAPGAANVHPADAELNLPPEMHSHGLRKRAAVSAARGSSAAAAAALTRASGVRLGKRQVQELTVRAAADFGDFYARRRHPPRLAPADVLALSCDAKGIVVLPGQMRPEWARKARKTVPKQHGRLSRGEVRNRKRMAETGAVFTITPVPRTAADILPPPGPAGPARPAPRATDKWVTASIARPAAAVVADVFAEADRRDPGHARTWIALADGNIHQLSRITAEARARGITITIICDFIHVYEYLWSAAWCFFPEASPHAAPWARQHAAAILDGRAAQVAAAIRDQITAAGTSLSTAKRKQATAAAHYLDTKAPYLDYPRALASGWPISSGIIEGTCRHLIKDRMDITGARWTVRGAEAILKIRALLANNDFDAYWTYHLQQERLRNHPASYQLAA